MSGFTQSDELHHLIDKGTAALRSILSSESSDDGAAADAPSAMKDLEVVLKDLKTRLCGEIEEADAGTISSLMQKSGLMMKLVDCIKSLSFDARNRTVVIFNNLLHRNLDGFVDYLHHHVQHLKSWLENYGAMATCCGSVLRECARYPQLARVLLHSSRFWRFFDVYMHDKDYEIASDAFNTMKELVTTPHCPEVAAEFLERHYKTFLEKYDVSCSALREQWSTDYTVSFIPCNHPARSS